MTALNRQKSRNCWLKSQNCQTNKVTFKEDNSLPVRKPSSDYQPWFQLRLRFAVPAGPRVLTSLVLGVVVDRCHPSKEAQSLLEQIRHIDGDFEFETYYSLLPTALDGAGAEPDERTEPAHQAHCN